MKALSELSEREVLALAITSEEEDSRIYQSFADRLRPAFEASAGIFDDMAEEERGHRDSLYDLYRERFGEHLPPIRREDVRGFLRRRTPWWEPSLDLDKMRGEAELMERQAANFYEKAASQATDVSVRQLFTHLAEVERGHERRAGEITEAHHTRETFLVGLAASVGAGISMGFTEALSDDGIITGRGSPVMRGIVCGVMTTLGGIGHTLPHLIPDTWPNHFLLPTLIATVV